ncbi:YkiB [Escherichia coli]|nr:YkiB [Escherichia coli]
MEKNTHQIGKRTIFQHVADNVILIHTRYKYQKHKPDKYLINIQQSLNYSIYSSTTKRKKK